MAPLLKRLVDLPLVDPGGLRELELPIGSVIINRNIPAYLTPEDLAKAAEGVVDADAVRGGLKTAGIEINRKMLSEMAINDPKSFAALVETVKNA